MDLFGHEIPNLADRKARLKSEKEYCQQSLTIISDLGDRDVENIGDAPDHSKQCVIRTNKDLILILSKRIQEMRETRIKRLRMVDRLKVEAGENWKQNSKLSFAINSIQTQIYRLEKTISDTLDSIDGLCYLNSICNNAPQLYRDSSKVNLNHQKNYVCIRQTGDVGIHEGDEHTINTSDPRSIKQKSSAWHELRSKARVTGSTRNTALGLGTLKAHIQHFDAAIHGKERTPFSDTVLKALEHGRSNEINGVATLVCKVLPALFPKSIYLW